MNHCSTSLAPLRKKQYDKNIHALLLFKIYCALKIIFTDNDSEKIKKFCKNHVQSYDTLINIRLNISMSSFLKRNDSSFFLKISTNQRFRPGKEKNFVDLLLSNFVYRLQPQKDNISIFSFFDDNSEKYLIEYEKNRSSVLYNLGNDLDTILSVKEFSNEINLCDLFSRPPESKHFPIIIELLNQKRIKWESVIILDNVLQFVYNIQTDHLPEFVVDHIWIPLKNKLQRFSWLLLALEFDTKKKQKATNIILNRLKSQSKVIK